MQAREGAFLDKSVERDDQARVVNMAPSFKSQDGRGQHRVAG